MSPSLHFPALYFPVAALLLGLLVELLWRQRQPWALSACLVYVTIFAWYFVDVFISPEVYNALPDAMLDFSYLQVGAFLLLYRLAVPWLTKKFARGAHVVFRRGKPLSTRTLFLCCLLFWAILLAIGITTMGGDVIGALFPLDARAASKVMWGRAGGADAGPTGFLISTGGYVYSLLCASFGAWLFFLRRTSDRLLAAGVMLVSWPFFYLSGTRSSFLAVSVPFFLAYLLLSRQVVWIKLVVLAIALVGMNTALRVALTYRTVGFRSLFSAEQVASDDTPDGISQHKGLNMIEELCYVDVYAQTEPISYGSHYLSELVGVVPRALWPGKPLLGIDYAIWRGFGGAENSDIGVFATISTGMIGGGVINFGRFFGPLASALLMAAWTALLARWWVQRASLLRALLYMAGMGLTFNLGRDITLLVLWPVVFGYLLVRMAEYVAWTMGRDLRARAFADREQRRKQRTSVQPVSAGGLAPAASTRVP